MGNVLSWEQVLMEIEDTIDGLVSLRTVIVPGPPTGVFKRRDGKQVLMAALGEGSPGERRLRIILVE